MMMMMNRNTPLAALLTFALLASAAAGNAFANSGSGFTPDELDRPLSTWAAGHSEAPDSNSEYTPPPVDDDEEPQDEPIFLGELLEGENIVFVLDRSGSMGSRMTAPEGTEILDRNGNVISNPTRWQVIQSECASAVSQMDDTFTFEFILFASNHTVCFNALAPADAAGRMQGLNFIYQHNAGGGTGFNGPLSHAFTHGGYDEMDLLVFMTDGYPFDGSAVQQRYEGWVAGQRSAVDDFHTNGYQVGGGGLNSFMSWLASASHTTVVLK